MVWFAVFLNGQLPKAERVKNAAVYAAVCLSQTAIAYVISTSGTTAIDALTHGGFRGFSSERVLTLVAAVGLSTYSVKLLFEELEERYADEEPLYLFTVNPDQEPKYIDAVDSTHVSHFFNHAQDPNTKHVKDKEARRIDFYLTRDVAAGEELTIDYGVGYWIALGIVPENDGRNFTRPPKKPMSSWRLAGPPPNVPLTPDALAAAVALESPLHDDREARAALLRALDFFGATRQADGRLLVPHGVGADAPQQLVEAESVPLDQLHHAAARCIAGMEPGRAPASLG